VRNQTNPSRHTSKLCVKVRGAQARPPAGCREQRARPRSSARDHYIYTPPFTQNSIAVRARRTIALKTPQLLDNTTSKYRKHPSGPNLVTPEAQQSGRGCWMATDMLDAKWAWSSHGKKRVRRLTPSCSEGRLIFRSARAEVPEDSRVLRERCLWFPTSNHLQTWLILSGTTRSRQYHVSTMVSPFHRFLYFVLLFSTKTA